MSEEYKDEFINYLDRAKEQLGDLAIGKYGKFEGQLVKKMDYDEFMAVWEKYLEIRVAYDEIIAQDATVNDAILQLLIEQASVLLIKY